MQNPNYFNYHTACPKCRAKGLDRSGDNLAVYNDGHQWCYRCGYHVPAPVTIETTKEKVNNVLGISQLESSISTKNCSHLPSDISSVLSTIAQEWLIQYDLTLSEMRRFWWSESKQQLIYPVFDLEGNLEFWQARNFAPELKTKYFTSGNVEDNLHILGEGNVLILVEDIVSSIKVARQYKSLPLFGSFINKQNLIRLRDYVLDDIAELGIWLDPDKFQDATRLCKKAQELGIRAFTILSRQDPKYYTNNQIQDIIEHWRNTVITTKEQQ